VQAGPEPAAWSAPRAEQSPSGEHQRSCMFVQYSTDFPCVARAANEPPAPWNDGDSTPARVHICIRWIASWVLLVEAAPVWTEMLSLPPNRFGLLSGPPRFMCSWPGEYDWTTARPRSNARRAGEGRRGPQRGRYIWPITGPGRRWRCVCKVLRPSRGDSIQQEANSQLSSQDSSHE